MWICTKTEYVWLSPACFRSFPLLRLLELDFFTINFTDFPSQIPTQQNVPSIMDGWRHFQNDVRRSKEAPLGMNKCVRRDGFTFAYETNKLNDTYPSNWIKWAQKTLRNNSSFQQYVKINVVQSLELIQCHFCSFFAFLPPLRKNKVMKVYQK